MNGVIGMTSLLAETSLTAEQRSYVETAQRSAEHLLSVINDILDFSKIEAGKLGLDPIPFDLHVAAAEVADLLAPRAREKNIEIVVRIAPDAPRRLVGDVGRVRQVLVNLAGNAVKFTERGHVLIDVEPREAPPGFAGVRLSVQDTGIGISADHLATLFHPFEQGDSSTTRRFGGTGLGLSISRRLVALMGGKIDVQSEPGRGSTFSFTIELPPGHEARSESRSPLQLSQASYRLLLAEDNALNRELIKIMLEQAGHEVVAVNDGAEAVRTAVRNSFDAILMDV